MNIKGNLGRSFSLFWATFEHCFTILSTFCAFFINILMWTYRREGPIDRFHLTSRKCCRHIGVQPPVAWLCKYNANEVHIANRSFSKMDCSDSEAKSDENVEATSSVPLSDYAKKLDQRGQNRSHWDWSRVTWGQALWTGLFTSRGSYRYFIISSLRD